MRQINLRLHDLISLEHDQALYDLHNDLEFLGLHLDTRAGSLTLSWQRRVRPWIRRTVPESIHLRFEEVVSLTVHPRDPEMPPGEDTTLSHMGYVHPDLPDPLGGVATEDIWLRDRQDDSRPFPMLFAFQGGQVIVVLAAQVSVQLR